jgi:hypothetical protein
MDQLPAFIQSSQDATKVSARVTGAVIAISSAIILGASQLFGIHLSTSDITSVATSLGMVAGAIWFVKGLILWAIVKIHSKGVELR